MSSNTLFNGFSIHLQPVHDFRLVKAVIAPFHFHPTEIRSSSAGSWGTSPLDLMPLIMHCRKSVFLLFLSCKCIHSLSKNSKGLISSIFICCLSLYLMSGKSLKPKHRLCGSLPNLGTESFWKFQTWPPWSVVNPWIRLHWLDVFQWWCCLWRLYLEEGLKTFVPRFSLLLVCLFQCAPRAL